MWQAIWTIVYKQNDKYRQMEWKIKKSFLLAATGLLKEAQDELDGVSGGSLPQRIVSGLLRDKCCICIRISISIPVVKWVLCMNIMHSWSVFTRTL